MEVICGLTSPFLSRLRRTWEGVNPKLRNSMDEMEGLLSPHENFTHFRNIVEKVDPPCIPYIGIYLSDLVVLDESMSDDVQGLINFAKREKIARILSNMSLFQQKPYVFRSVGILREYLSSLECSLDEDGLNQLSEKREPS